MPCASLCFLALLTSRSYFHNTAHLRTQSSTAANIFLLICIGATEVKQASPSIVFTKSLWWATILNGYQYQLLVSILPGKLFYWLISPQGISCPITWFDQNHDFLKGMFLKSTFEVWSDPERACFSYALAWFSLEYRLMPAVQLVIFGVPGLFYTICHWSFNFFFPGVYHHPKFSYFLFPINSSI